jgi:hypothetical protein
MSNVKAAVARKISKALGTAQKMLAGPAVRRRRLDIDKSGARLDSVAAEYEAMGPILRQPAPPYDVPAFPIPAVPVVPEKAPRARFLASEENPLQASINAAAEGSILEVPAGSYPESIEVGKSIHLVAQGEVTIASDTRRHSVNSTSPLLTLTGFRITVDESQAENPIYVPEGNALFRNCTIRSSETVAANVTGTGSLFLIDCQVSGGRTHALKVSKNGRAVAERSTFRSEDGITVRVAGDSVTRFQGCLASTGASARSAFLFFQNAQYLFEEVTLDFPVDIFAQSKHGVFRNCIIQKIPVTVAKSGTPYFIGCTFNQTSLICREKCGVRLIRDKFIDNPTDPGLIVMGEATVEANECEFRKNLAPAAAVAYQTCSMKLFDGRFIDLAGVGVLAFDRVELGIERCGFGNCANYAICAHSGPEVVISGSLVNHTNSVGVFLKRCSKAEIIRSKIIASANSGMEINGLDDCLIDHCIFEANGQFGLVGIGAELTVNESDFVRNKMSGLEFRNTKFIVTKSIAVDNLGGGFAFRQESNGEINGGGAGTNQQFGIAVFDAKTTVKSEDFKVLDNDHLGVLATGGAELTIDRPLITGHTGVAVMVDGRETKLGGDEWTLTENGVGLQMLDGAMVRTKKSKFKDNALHVEARGKAKLVANHTQFAQSRNGVGLFITAQASGEFTACVFSDEAKTAIVSDSQVAIKNSQIIGCGTCGLFFFGAADAELTANTISNNASCGVQVMAGTVVLSGNTITDHTVFGVHVQPTALVEDNGNTYSSNYMADVNHEQESPT